MVWLRPRSVADQRQVRQPFHRGTPG